MYTVQRCEQACPYSVNPAELILKAQIKYSKENKKEFLKLLFSNYFYVGKLASVSAPIANLITSSRSGKKVMGFLGLRKDIQFPEFSFKRLKQGKQNQLSAQSNTSRKKAVFFHGCYLNSNEPETGRKIIKLMELSGIEIVVPKQVCCGLPAIGNGNLKKAESFAKKNIKVFKKYLNDGYDLIYSCTSCGHTLINEYPSLAENESGRLIAQKSFDLYEYLIMLIDEGSLIYNFTAIKEKISYHIPCHLKGTGVPYPAVELFKRVQGLELTIYDENCCGFSGSYGFKEKNRETAEKLGKIAVEALVQNNPSGIISDCGACRMQISNYTDIPVYDPIELLLKVLKGLKHT